MEKLSFILEMKENISRQLKDVAKATEDITKTTDKVSKGFSGLTDEIKGVAPASDKLAKGFGGFKGIPPVLDGVGDSTKGVGDEAKKASDSLKGAGDSAGYFRDENGRLRDANGRFVKDTEKLNNGLGKQEGFFKKTANAAKSYAGVIATALGGAALAGFSKGVLQTGMDFDAAMSEVQALSGATGADLGKLREKAKQMGSTTKFSAIESAEAFKYMSLAGWDANEMLDGADGILSAAAASGEELGLVADIITDNLSAFGLAAKDSTMMADGLAKTSTETNTSVAELGEAFKYSGAAAHASGLEFQEASAFLGLLANNAIKGSSGGTVLNAVLRDMKKNAKGGKVAIGKTSVAVYDANGNMRKFSNIIADVEKATKGMTQEQRDAAMATIFGDEAMRGINIALSEGSDELKRLEKNIYDSKGAAEEMADIQLDNLKGDITNLSSAWEGLKIALFDTGFGNVFRPLVQGADEAISAVSNFATKIGIMFSGDDLDIIKETFEETFSGEEIEALVEKGEQFKEMFDSIKEIIMDLGEAFQETFGDTLMEMFEWLKETINNFIESASENFEMLKPSLEALGEVFSEVWEVIGEVFTTAWGIIQPILNFMMQLFMTIGQIASLVFMAIIVPAVQLVWTAFQNAWSIIQPILDLFGAALEVAGDAAVWLLDNAITPLATFVAGAFKAAIDLGEASIGFMSDGFQKLGDWVNKVKDLFQQFVDKVKNFKPPEWMSKIGGAIGSAASAVGNFVAGSHASGAYNIPYDGYVAELHAGESVLTAGQSQMLRNLGVLQQTSGNRPDVRPEVMAQTIAPSTTTNTQRSASISVGDVNVQVSGSNASPQEIGQAVKRALNKEVNKAAAVLGF